MGTQGIVVPPGKGPVANYSAGRSIIIKLKCAETDGSIMMFDDRSRRGQEHAAPPSRQ